jgi:hypothetical protein
VGLQIAGLLLLPLAMAGNLAPTDALPLGTMLTLTAVGVLLFLVGVALRRTGGGR